MARVVKPEDRIKRALEELHAVLVPEATRPMLCGGIRAAIQKLEGTRTPYGMECIGCGRALLKAELSRHFRDLCLDGEIASSTEQILEAAAMEAGWGMCPTPHCPACVPECTDPIMGPILKALQDQ